MADKFAFRLDRNYLRVRGEYVVSSVCAAVIRELPPRARRIHKESGKNFFHRGTTSACAENTIFPYGL